MSQKPYTFTQVPEPTKKDQHGDTYEHPSFGTIKASRFSGGGRRPMFGSKILHDGNGRVAIEITGASYTRNLHNDWIHPRQGIIEIQMTESQFARFITSPNQQAVPCTIVRRWDDGRYVSVEDPPFFEIIDQFSVELESKMEKVKADSVEMLKKLDEMLKGKTVSTTELSEIRSKVMTVLGYLPGSLDFMKDQFEEAMADTVEEAKLEIETHINRTLTHLGIEGARHLVSLPERSAAGLLIEDGEESVTDR
jgi:ElaB/YqjD/DUF883 family membrane-anchored ribosome-binding protein